MIKAERSTEGVRRVGNEWVGLKYKVQERKLPRRGVKGDRR